IREEIAAAECVSFVESVIDAIQELMIVDAAAGRPCERAEWNNIVLAIEGKTRRLIDGSLGCRKEIQKCRNLRPRACSLLQNLTSRFRWSAVKCGSGL